MLDPRARARFLRHRAGMVGAALTLVLFALALFGPMLAGKDPYASDFAHGISPDTGMPSPPSSEFLLGTDRLFRDQLARVALGARLSLIIAVGATVISSVLGAVVGMVAGYYEGTPGVRIPWPFLASAVAGLVAMLARESLTPLALAILGGVVVSVLAEKRDIGWLAAGPSVNIDTALMRLVDVGLCFPFLLLVMAMDAALERATTTSIIAILGLTGWLGAARVFRAKTMEVRHLEYVVASRALGLRTPQVLLRHVFPNVASTFVVLSSSAAAQMILYESALSYLGGGIAPPTPTWGRMLFEGQDLYAAAPWLVMVPGGAILLAVLGFNLLGEGLRDALDPRQG